MKIIKDIMRIYYYILKFTLKRFNQQDMKASFYFGQNFCMKILIEKIIYLQNF